MSGHPELKATAAARPANYAEQHIRCSIPLKTDAKAGENWADMKAI